MDAKPTERFTDRAATYAHGRPSYPPESVTFLFAGLGEPPRVRVVDLGAGTGISSVLLAARGARVVAVEPNASMREHAAETARVRWQSGTAEATGLSGDCADLVTAFQAFHWFDAGAALDEIARILRPGGTAAVVYNERDARDDFTAAYGELVRRYATDETEARRNDARAAFAAYSGWVRLQTATFANPHVLDRAGFHARAYSTSYLPQGDAHASALHAAMDALFSQYASAGSVTLQMATSVTSAVNAKAA